MKKILFGYIFLIFSASVSYSQCVPIYAVNNQSPALLGLVNQETGAVTTVATLTGATSALAKDPVSGNLFFSLQSSPFNLYSYNPTTSVTSAALGGSGLSDYFNKLAFAPNGNLYGFINNSNVLYQINISNGVATSLGSVTGFQTGDGDIAFIPGSNTMLYGISKSGGNSNLFTLTIAGAPSATNLGGTGVGTLTGIAVRSDNNLYTYSATNYYIFDTRDGSTDVFGTSAFNVTDLASSPVLFIPGNIALSGQSSDCFNGAALNNGSVFLHGFGAYDKYSLTATATYTGSANYSSATQIPSNGVLLSNLTNTTANYSVRIFNVDGCTLDQSVSITPVNCAITCGSPGKDGVAPATVTGALQTYQTVSPTASSGSSTLSLTSLGTPVLTVGDQLLIIQMQGVDITSANDATYGTQSNIIAGNYEYAVVTSISGAGPFNVELAKPLTNTYVNSLNSGGASQGNKRFQIIRVPQYSSMTVPTGGLNVQLWNGTVGGVLVLDISGVLNMNGQTINGIGRGFRGGGGRSLSGTGGSLNDYLTLVTANKNASKGEGIAGTPQYINGPTGLINNLLEGYPNGSYARGAPGNAGGGGTDGNSGGNDQNTGGGGGGNGGAGGNGGWGWRNVTPYQQRGGFGGNSFAANPFKIVMGGGGGAGVTNNSTGTYKGFGVGYASSGHSGGAIVIIRAGSITGTGTIDVSGGSWRTSSIAGDVLVNNDAAGGGGAGGSIIIGAVDNSGLQNIIAKADGGEGTSLRAAIHGPGGGGGGGVIFSNGTLSTVSSANLAVNGLSFPTGNFGASIGYDGVKPVLGGNGNGLMYGAGATCGVPIAVNDLANTNEKSPVTINLLSNDINPLTLSVTGLTLTGITLVGPNIGTVSTTGSGAFTFRYTSTVNLALGTITTTSYRYTVCNFSGCSTALGLVTVTGVNDPPVAVNNTVTGIYGGIRLGTITGFSDPDNSLSQLTVSGLSPIASGTFGTVNTIPGGTVTISGIGQIRYTSSIPGIYTVPFQVCDPTVTCSSAVLTIIINGIPPVANPINTTTGINTPISLCASCQVTGGPLNPATLTLSGVPPLSTGSVSVNTTTGFVTFVPTATFTGITSFTYGMCSLAPVSCTSALITISVTGTPPIASPINTATGVNTPISVCAICNVSGGPINPATLTVSGVPPLSTGTVSVNTVTGRINFTPTATFSGIATFNYNVCSLFPISCTSALITISVTGTPIVATPINTSTGINTPITLCASCNVTGGPINPTTLTFSGILPLSTGSVSVNTITGSVTFIPTATFTGVATFNYNICSLFPVSCTSALITVSVTGTPPVAAPIFTSTGINTPISVCARCNVTGGPLNNATLTVSGLTPSTSGSVSVNTTTGFVTFTPNATFTGISTISYGVCSLFPVSCTSSLITVSVTGTPPIAAPINTTTGINTPISLCATCQVSGGPINPATLTVSGLPPVSTGSVSVNTITGSVIFIPTATFTGITTFNYNVCSLFPVSCTSALVTVSVTGNPPLASPIVTTTGINTPVNVCALCNASGGPINPSSLTVTLGTSPGIATVNTTTGIVTFTPNATFTGTTVFRYTICSLFPISCTSANITVTVNGTPPVANPIFTSTGINTPISVCARCNVTGGPLNNATLTVSGLATSTSGSVSVNTTTGFVTFSPNATFTGISTISYGVCSLFPVSCTSSLITVSVTGTPPIAAPINTTTGINTPISLCATCQVSGGPINPATLAVSGLPPVSTGSVSVNTTTGSVIFTPTATFTGITTFNYNICSLFPVSCTSALVTVSVTGNPPLASPIVTTTGINTPVNVCALCNSSGGPINPSSLTVTLGTSPGIATVNTTTGLVTFTPNATFTGTTVFRYNVCSLFPISCTSANITVTVNGTPPVANPIFTSTGINTPISVCARCNVTGGPLNNATLTVSGLAPSTSGSVSVNTTTGFVTFTPNATFTGISTISYGVCSLFPVSCTSSLITVSVTGTPPIAAPINTTTGINTPISLCATCQVSGGPINPATLTVSGLPPVSTGSVSVNTTTGSVIFTPTATFTGITTFSYNICSLFPASCTSALVTVSVTGNPPLASPIVTTTGINTPVNVCALCNASGGPINPSSLTVTLGTSPGIATVNTTTGIVTFTPNATFTGTTVFRYTICSLFPVSCTSANITVTVNGTPPVANPIFTSTGINTPISVCARCNVTGGPLNNATLTVSGLTPLTSGSVSVNTTTGFVTFTPNATFTGISTISYGVCNLFPVSCTSSLITISVTGTAPIVPPLNTTTGINSPVTVCAFCSATGGPNDPKSLTVTTGTAPGIVSVNTVTGIVTFTPNGTFTGVTSFTYTLCSLFPSSCVSNLITVSVTGSAPIADPIVTSTGVNTSVSVCALCFTHGGPNEPSSLSVNIGTAPGIATVNTTTGFVTFTPNATFTGITVFTYNICSKFPALCTSSTITVTVNASPPVVNPISTVTSLNTPVTICGICNVTGGPLDLKTLTVIGVPPLTTGSVTVNTTTGAITFTPTATFTGIVSFTYQICSSFPVDCKSALITITVNGVPPIATNDLIVTDEKTPVSINLLTNDNNPTTAGNLGLTLTGISLVGNSIGTISTTAGGGFIFTPTINLPVGTSTTTSYQYTVSNSFGSSTALVLISVSGVNDSPSVINQTVTGVASTMGTSTITGFSDPDNSLTQLTVSGIGGVLVPGVGTINTIPGGTVTIGGSGLVTFTSSTPGTYVVPFQVCDPTVTCTSANLTVIITPLNIVANNDLMVTDENSPISINLLTNDFDPATLTNSGLSLTGISLVGNAIGAITSSVNGNITFTPTVNLPLGAITTTSYLYTVCNATSCATALGLITVTGVNNPPIAISNTVTGLVNSIKSGTITGFYDTDNLLSELTVSGIGGNIIPGVGTISTIPGGTVTIDGLGFIQYTGSIPGTYTLPFQVCDPTVTCTNAILHVVIQSAGISIANDSTITNQNTPVVINVLGNDFSSQWVLDSASVDLDPSTPTRDTVFFISDKGRFTVDSKGKVTFVPVSSFAGEVSSTYTVKNSLGETSNVATIKVKVLPSSEDEPFIPEGFSPDGDGVNDKFVIQRTNGKTIKFYVYNRWGNLIFGSEDYKNDWDGTLNGAQDSKDVLKINAWGNTSEIPDGTYFYYIEIGDKKPGKSSSFTLRRNK